jgi:hypothetical protein
MGAASTGATQTAGDAPGTVGGRTAGGREAAPGAYASAWRRRRAVSGRGRRMAACMSGAEGGHGGDGLSSLGCLAMAEGSEGGGVAVAGRSRRGKRGGDDKWG